MSDRPYDESKFIELVIYVADRLRDAPAGGATKLNKACWYAEIEFFRRYGTTITGADYQKLEWGPAPRRLLPIRDRLVQAAQAEIVESALGNQTEQRLVPLRPANTTVFTDDELAVIDLVLSRLHPMNAREVSDLSHEEAAWRLPEMRETIEPELAYLRPAVLNQRVRDKARQVAAHRGLLPD